MTQRATAPRFERLRVLGDGGMGVVYEARDLERGERVALKKLRSTSPSALVRFKREFRAAQGLQHPNIVALGELFSEEGEWFFTMELVEGQDFIEYVRGHARLALHAALDDFALPEPGDFAAAPTVPRLRAAAAAPLFDEEKLRSGLRQLAEAITALHAAGLVHRDVKPSNIRVTAEGRVVLLDFGLVTEVGNEHRTTAHDIVGTPAYMAPEQATRSDVGPEADWYSVGVLLYEALVGQIPFSGAPIDVLMRKQSTHPAPPSEVDPNVPPDLDRLCSDLLRFDPAARSTGAHILRALGTSEVRARAEPLTTQRTLDAPFVGRATETRLLQDALRDSRARGAVSVVVSGESGVGKTTLVRRFVDSARALDPGVVVLMDRCYERESVPYKALDGIVDALARLLSRLSDEDASSLLPTRVGPLAQVFPVLQRVGAIERLSRAAGRAVDPSELRARAFEAMRELLVRLADRTPLIVVIDDAQWADSDSGLLLQEILRPPEAPNMMLVATIRAASDESGVVRPAELLTGTLPGDVRRIELARLPYEEGCALATVLLERSRAVHPADARRIAEESGGHPLFIDTLVRSEARAAVLGGEALHLEDVLWDEIQRLDSLAGLTMRLLAVAGTPLPQEARAKALAAEPDAADLPRKLALLRAAHLVQTTGARKRDGVACYHDRVRATVLAHLPRDERAPLHRRLALALESAHESAENVALHWLGAGEPGRAVEHTIRAADAAASALAFEQAAVLYRRALDLNVLDQGAIDAVKMKLAESFAKAGRGVEAAAVYLGIAEDGSSNRAIDLRRRAGEQLVCSGHLTEGLRTFDEALAALGFRRPQSSLAVFVSFLLWKTWIAVRGLRFVSRSEDDLDPRALLRVDCLASAGPGLGMTDHFRGSAFQVRTLAEALRLGEPTRLGRALAYYALSLASAGMPVFARVMDLQRRVERMARELARPYLAGLACGVTGFAHFMIGKFPEAHEAFERAEAILRDECVGVSYELATARIMHFRTLIALGELQAVAAPAAACLSDAERKGDSYTTLSIRGSVTPFLALARDDVAGARAEMESAEAHLPKGGGFLVQHFYRLHSRVQIAMYEGDAARALDEMARALPALRRSMLLRVQTIRIRFHDARAAALISSGGPRAREAERDIAALEREGITWATAQAHLLRAAVSARAGDRAAALGHLVAAESGFGSASMRVAEAVAQRQRGQLLGGDEGRSLIRGGDSRMATAQVRNPGRMSLLYSPGLAG